MSSLDKSQLYMYILLFFIPNMQGNLESTWSGSKQKILYLEWTVNTARFIIETLFVFI